MVVQNIIMDLCLVLPELPPLQSGMRPFPLPTHLPQTPTPPPLSPPRGGGGGGMSDLLQMSVRITHMLMMNITQSTLARATQWYMLIDRFLS